MDREGILRSVKQDEMPIFVPKALTPEVLNYVHGSRMSGHYKMRRTLAKPKGRY